MGPHRLTAALGIPRSTIGDVLRRHGLSRLADRDRPTGIPIRYVRERPGDLLHMDVKKLGRIPDGGGHRFRGRGQGTPRAHAGYDYVHQVVDDMSRVAYAASAPTSGARPVPPSCVRRRPSSPASGCASSGS